MALVDHQEIVHVVSGDGYPKSQGCRSDCKILTVPKLRFPEVRTMRFRNRGSAMSVDSTPPTFSSMLRTGMPADKRR